MSSAYSINGTICRDQYAVSNHLCEYFTTVADGIGDTSVVEYYAEYDRISRLPVSESSEF